MVLVLDDLHRLTAAAPLEELAYVLRNARRGLHVVVASRADPPLPLHRYRLIGELAEVRADDLAFRVPEASSLLSHHGVTLSAHAPQSLTGPPRAGRRASGWPPSPWSAVPIPSSSSRNSTPRTARSPPISWMRCWTPSLPPRATCCCAPASWTA